MDPLSDVLSLLKPQSYMCGGFDVGAGVAIQFGQHEGIKCYAVVRGQCFLHVEGTGEPVRMVAGDCWLLPSGRPFVMATDMTVAPVDYRAVLTLPTNGRVSTIGGGGAALIVGGYFGFAGSHSSMLLSALPAIAHIQKESDKAAMRWSLERMSEELREPQPGGFLVAQQLAYMMLVQALRLHLAEGLKGGVGWLFALADRQMSEAMRQMHGDPARRWTLQELGECAGMSRSSFAQKFKETVGASPMEYLTRWRMLLAGDRLTTSHDAVSEIAMSLGYESESAFSTAFKRVMGCSPRQYGRGEGTRLQAVAS